MKDLEPCWYCGTEEDVHTRQIDVTDPVAQEAANMEESLAPLLRTTTVRLCDVCYVSDPAAGLDARGLYVYLRNPK